MTNLQKLIKAECSNMSDYCLLTGKECHATKKQCKFFENNLIPLNNKLGKEYNKLHKLGK